MSMMWALVELRFIRLVIVLVRLVIRAHWSKLPLGRFLCTVLLTRVTMIRMRV